VVGPNLGPTSRRQARFKRTADGFSCRFRLPPGAAVYVEGRIDLDALIMVVAGSVAGGP
jgi:hypothetical protein